MDLKGKFFGTRTKSVYNIYTQTIQEYKNNIEYEIKKISNVQYLVKQTNLEKESTIMLIFFKNNTGYTSSSVGGIDNIYLNCCDNFIHDWSIPIDLDGNLTNSHTVLNKII